MNEEAKVNPEDFTAAEHAAVDAMAANIITSNKANKSFAGKRNRDVWKRMNRPHKIKAIESGASKINVFFDKVMPAKETEEEAHILAEKQQTSLERLKEIDALLDTVEDRIV